MKDELENKVLWLFPEITETKTAKELYCMGYEPTHRTFRKTTGDYQICYRQVHRSAMFEVGAIIRVGREDINSCSLKGGKRK